MIKSFIDILTMQVIIKMCWFCLSLEKDTKKKNRNWCLTCERLIFKICFFEVLWAQSTVLTRHKIFSANLSIPLPQQTFIFQWKSMKRNFLLPTGFFCIGVWASKRSAVLHHFVDVREMLAILFPYHVTVSLYE